MSMTPQRGKLVWISTRVPYPPVTGHFLRSYNVLKGLAEQYDVYFFGFFDRGTSDQDAARALAALGSFCTQVYAEHVRSERNWAWLVVDLVRSVLARKPFVAIKYLSPRLESALRDVLNRYPIALVHADSLPSGEYLLKLPHAKLLTNHNVEFVRLRRHADVHRVMVMRFFLRWQAHLTRRFELDRLRTIGNCVVVSEGDRSFLFDLLPEVTYFVVNNGADTSIPALPPANNQVPTALWVGGMNDPYNRESVLHFLHNILPLVQQALPALRWRVVGASPPSALVNAARSPDSGIDLVGFVDDLRAEYAAADIVVAPITAGGGTKLKVLEAMAMGRAVVTTPVGAEGIPARDHIELEVANSPTEFARRIVELVSDTNRRDNMAKAARELIERAYDWRVINAQMADAVCSVIQTVRREECGS